MANDRKLTVALSSGGSLKNLARSKNKVTTWPDLVKTLSHCHVDDITFKEYLALPTLDQGTRKNRPGPFVGGSFLHGRRDVAEAMNRSLKTVYCWRAQSPAPISATMLELLELKLAVKSTQEA